MISEITRRGIRAARHDLGDFPARAWLSALHDSNGWSGRIIGPDTTTNLDEVVAMYYRLEGNPSAQWLWLHHTAGLPITAALADLLTLTEDPA